MPRFVVLEHDHPYLHWDLMLEAGESLRTWRLAAPPQVGTECAAQALGHHRLMYLDHEGPVSGNRGSVRRWDAGELTWLKDSPREARASLHGRRFRGQAWLRALATGEWTLQCGEGSDQA